MGTQPKKTMAEIAKNLPVVEGEVVEEETEEVEEVEETTETTETPETTVNIS